MLFSFAPFRQFCLTLLLGTAFYMPLHAQVITLQEKPIGNGPSDIKPLSKINVGGYYRFFGWGRNLEQPFVVVPGNAYASAPPHVIGFGDVYRDPPMLLLNISAQPTSKTYVGMDYALYHNFTGVPGNSPVNLNLGINLTGSIQTEYGRFTAHMGGINWIDLSGMVFSSFVGYQRFSIYERWPWEGNAVSYDRAANYFSYGNISRDMRFGMQPFKGLMIDGNELPGNINLRLLYGVTPAQVITSGQIPSYTFGGRIRKKAGNHMLGFNTMDYRVYLDSVAREQAGMQLYTFSYDFKYKDWNLAFEGGTGRLYSAVQEQGWGPAARINVRTPKKLLGVPLEAELFYISPEFINYYGNFLSFNTNFVSTASLNQNGSVPGGSGGITNFAGSITDVGQTSNNRKGYSLNTWFEPTTSTRFNLGIMNALEIDAVSKQLAFGHKINALPFSRFAPFTNNIGSYANWTSYFRGFSQSMTVTDTNAAGMPKQLMGFNMLQTQIKQFVNLPYAPFYLLYTGSFGSAQYGMKWAPVLNNKAMLRTWYHELDAVFKLSNKVTLLGTFGYERIIGNNSLNKGDNVDGIIGSANNDPVNQTGKLYGAGLDIKLSKDTYLYCRRRWFSQTDKSFVKDNIKGNETSLEIKIFF